MTRLRTIELDAGTSVLIGGALLIRQPGLVADLVGRARTYAAEADEARAAGLTCERAYDAARQALGQRGGKYGF